jgi:hypothetical protein
MIPAITEPMLARRVDALDCRLKNVPRYSKGKIYPIRFCQAFAANPAPSPCQINIRKVSTTATGFPINGKNRAINARPRKSTLSWIVITITKGLKPGNFDILFAVNSWGSCHPILWMAGIKPINNAELIIVETNKGRIAVKEAKPIANPKKPPSRRFAM